jgi:hypothetical protein
VRGGLASALLRGQVQDAVLVGAASLGRTSLAEGILTIADMRTGAPAACTLCQHTELPLPLTGPRRSGSMPSDEPLRRRDGARQNRGGLSGSC